MAENMNMDGIWELAEVLESSPSSGSGATHGLRAQVTRIDNDGTIWVHIPGGNEETPVSNSSASVTVGDTVSTSIARGNAMIDGNFSNPSAQKDRVDSIELLANRAEEDAGRARVAADSAQQSADQAAIAAANAQDDADTANAAAASAQRDATAAGTAAANAQRDATTANNAANSALYDLSVVEDVIGVLNWAQENAEFVLTSDISIVDGKVYWSRSSSEPYTYTPVPNPVLEDLPTYYEIDGNVMADYISSHLVLLDDGLYVMQDGSSWKVRVDSNSLDILDSLGHVYTTVDPTGLTVNRNGMWDLMTRIGAMGMTISSGISEMLQLADISIFGYAWSDSSMLLGLGEFRSFDDKVHIRAESHYRIGLDNYSTSSTTVPTGSSTLHEYIVLDESIAAATYIQMTAQVGFRSASSGTGNLSVVKFRIEYNYDESIELLDGRLVVSVDTENHRLDFYFTDIRQLLILDCVWIYTSYSPVTLPAYVKIAGEVTATDDDDNLHNLTEKADADHVHSAEDITSGTLDYARFPQLLDVTTVDITVSSTAHGTNKTATGTVDVENCVPIGVIGWRWKSGTRQNFFNVYRLDVGADGTVTVSVCNLHSTDAANGVMAVEILLARHELTAEWYEGDYNIVPSRVSQTMETQGKVMRSNVDIDAIPRRDVPNEYGTTVIIGDDE